MNIIWSPQQEAIFDAIAESPNSHVVEAVAGGSKTSTIVEGLSRTQLPALCVAYNKRIATELEAKLKPNPNATSQTMNSVGHRAWAKAIGKRLILDTDKLYKIIAELDPGDNFADCLGLARAARTAGIIPASWPARGLLLDEPGAWEELAEYFDIEFNHDILTVARQALLKSIKQAYAGTIDFDDQIYMSALFGGSFIKTPTVIIDEAQDLSELQHKMLEKMVGERLFIVGDRHQCHPPGTKIYVTGNGWTPIESLLVGQELATFNPRKTYAPGKSIQGRKIEHIHKSHFSGNLVRAQFESESVTMTPNHKVLTKFGSTKGVALYAMRRGTQCRLGICDLYYNGAQSVGISSRARQEKADAAWILHVFPTRQEALNYEAAFSALFGIPDLIWECSGESSKSKESLIQAWALIGDNAHRLEALLSYFGRNINFPLWDKTKTNYIGVNKSFITEACNLMDGMCFAIWADNSRPEWRTVYIDSLPYTGLVYGLQVQPNECGQRLYWANKFCVHNSIYGFRGAHAKSMDLLAGAFDASPLDLSVSYRCPQLVVAEAKRYVPKIEAWEHAPQGIVESHQQISLAAIPSGAHIVCRYNGPIFKLAWALIKSGRPATILGADIGAGLVKLIKKLAPEPVPIKELLSRLRSWAAAEIERKPQREAIIRDREVSIISLSEAVHTSAELCALIDKLFAAGGTVTLSSIHKAKGLEWDTVIFYLPQLLPSRYATTPWQLEQEDNLAYVAITRAKQRLIFVEEMI